MRIDVEANATEQQQGLIPSATVNAYLGAGFEATSQQYTDKLEITTDNMALGIDHRTYTFFIQPV